MSAIPQYGFRYTSSYPHEGKYFFTNVYRFHSPKTGPEDTRFCPHRDVVIHHDDLDMDKELQRTIG